MSGRQFQAVTSTTLLVSSSPLPKVPIQWKKLPSTPLKIIRYFFISMEKFKICENFRFIQSTCRHHLFLNSSKINCIVFCLIVIIFLVMKPKLLLMPKIMVLAPIWTLKILLRQFQNLIRSTKNAPGRSFLLRSVFNDAFWVIFRSIWSNKKNIFRSENQFWFFRVLSRR